MAAKSTFVWLVRVFTTCRQHFFECKCEYSSTQRRRSIHGIALWMTSKVLRGMAHCSW